MTDVIILCSEIEPCLQKDYAMNANVFIFCELLVNKAPFILKWTVQQCLDSRKLSLGAASTDNLYLALLQFDTSMKVWIDAPSSSA